MRATPWLLGALGVVLVMAPGKSQPRPDRLPAGVKVDRNLAYVANGGRRQKLDLYRPEGARSPLPVLVWIHGGAWQTGSKDMCPLIGAGFVKRGYAVASIGYRLTDEAVFPAQIHDCKAAVRWLRASAAKYGLDPDHLGAWGASAGGHLAAMLGTAGGVKEFDQGEYLDQSSAIQAAVDFFGPSDLVAMVTTPGFESHAAYNAPEAKLIGGTVLDHRELAAKASPATYVSKESAPFFIAHGDHDRTVPVQQSQLLHEALQRAGSESQLEVIAGAGHGGAEFAAPALNERIAKFLDQHLRPSSRRH